MAKDWDKQTERVNLRTPEARMINNKIEGVKAELYYIFHKYEYNPKLSIDLIIADYKGLSPNNESKESVVTFFKNLVEQRKADVGRRITSSTYYKYKLTFNHFVDFLKTIYHRKDISFVEVDYTIIIEFEKYLYTYHKECCNNTIVRKMKVLKTVMIDAQKRGLINKDPFVGCKFHLTPTDRGYLNDEEVQSLIQHEFQCKRLEQIRDFFLFSIFTGLSFSDIKNLTAENIIIYNGAKWIKKAREKTSVTSRVPLLPIAEAILEKYKGQEKKGKLLPLPSNQKYNSYLKEIADFCGIKKRLTSHLGRHTFATMTLTKGVSIESVSRMLGHTSIRTTQIYAKITAKKIEEDMKEFVEKIDHFSLVPQSADLSSNPHLDAIKKDAVEQARINESTKPKRAERPKRYIELDAVEQNNSTSSKTIVTNNDAAITQKSKTGAQAKSKSQKTPVEKTKKYFVPFINLCEPIKDDSVHESVADSQTAPVVTVEQESTVVTPPKKRGRPRKVDCAVTNKDATVAQKSKTDVQPLPQPQVAPVKKKKNFFTSLSKPIEPTKSNSKRKSVRANQNTPDVIAEQESTVVTPPRKRGRPRKVDSAVTNNDVTVTTSIGGSKSIKDNQNTPAVIAEQEPTVVTPPKKRGRPRKVDSEVTNNDTAVTQKSKTVVQPLPKSKTAPEKKKKNFFTSISKPEPTKSNSGRKSVKDNITAHDANAKKKSTVVKPQKKRGRPRKVIGAITYIDAEDGQEFTTDIKVMADMQIVPAKKKRNFFTSLSKPIEPTVSKKRGRPRKL